MFAYTAPARTSAVVAVNNPASAPYLVTNSGTFFDFLAVIIAATNPLLSSRLKPTSLLLGTPLTSLPLTLPISNLLDHALRRGSSFPIGALPATFLSHEMPHLDAILGRGFSAGCIELAREGGRASLLQFLYWTKSVVKAVGSEGGVRISEDAYKAHFILPLFRALHKKFSEHVTEGVKELIDLVGVFDKGYAYDMRRPEFVTFGWADKRKMVEAYTIALKEKAATTGQIYTRRRVVPALPSPPSSSSSATVTPVVTPTASILVISDYFGAVQTTSGKTQEEIAFEDVVDFVAVH